MKILMVVTVQGDEISRHVLELECLPRKGEIVWWMDDMFQVEQVYHYADNDPHLNPSEYRARIQVMEA